MFRMGMVKGGRIKFYLPSSSFSPSLFPCAFTMSGCVCVCVSLGDRVGPRGSQGVRSRCCLTKCRRPPGNFLCKWMEGERERERERVGCVGGKSGRLVLTFFCDKMKFQRSGFSSPLSLSLFHNFALSLLSFTQYINRSSSEVKRLEN